MTVPTVVTVPSGAIAPTAVTVRTVVTAGRGPLAPRAVPVPAARVRVARVPAVPVRVPPLVMAARVRRLRLAVRVPAVRVLAR